MAGNIVFRFVGDIAHVARSATQVNRIFAESGRAARQSMAIDTRPLARELDNLARQSERVARAAQTASQQMQAGARAASAEMRTETAAVGALATQFDRLARSAQSASNASRTVAGGVRGGAGGAAEANRQASSTLRNLAQATTSVGALGVAAAGVGTTWALMNRQVRNEVFSRAGAAMTRAAAAARGTGEAVAGVGEAGAKAAVGTAKVTTGLGRQAGNLAAATAGYLRAKGPLGAFVDSTGKLQAAVLPAAIGMGVFSRAFDLGTRRMLGSYRAVTSQKGSFAGMLDLSQSLRSRSNEFSRQMQGTNAFFGDASPWQRAARAGLRTGWVNIVKEFDLQARRGVLAMARGYKVSFLTSKLGAGILNRQGDDISSRKVMGSLYKSTLSGVAGGLLMYGAFTKVYGILNNFARSTVHAGARVAELDVAMKLLGKNSGYSGSALDGQVDKLKELGIETKQAQGAVSQFLKSNLDLAKVPALADVARNSAIFAGEDTSQTLERIIWGIQTRQPEVLRTAGLNVSFEREFANTAGTLKKTVSELTEADKATAALNAVLREGKSVAGAYEAAMTTAGKQARSTARYTEELRNAIGGRLEPAYAAAVTTLNDFLIKLRPAVSGTAPLATAIGAAADRIKSGFQGANVAINSFVSGGGVDRAVSAWQRFTKQTGRAQPVLGMLAAHQGTNFVRQLGGIGESLVPFKPWMAASAALVASNSDVRASLREVGTGFARAGEIIGAAALPILEKASDFIERNGDTIKAFGKDIGTFIESSGRVTGGMLGMYSSMLNATPVIDKVAAGLERLNIIPLAGISMRSIDLGKRISGMASQITMATGAFLLMKTVWSAAPIMKAMSGIVQGASTADQLRKSFERLSKNEGKQFLSGALKNTGSFLSVAGKVAKVAGVAAIAIAAVAGAVQIYAWAQARAEERTRRLGTEVLRTTHAFTNFESIKRSEGPGAAITAMAGDLEELRRKAEAAKAPIKETQQAAQAALDPAVARFRAESPIAKIYGVSGQDLARIREDVNRANGVFESELNKERLDAGVKIGTEEFTKRLEEYRNSLGDYAGQVGSDMIESQRKVSDSVIAIGTALKSSKMSFVDYSSLTQGQVKKIEDQVAELTQMTQNWGNEATSISAALLREDVKSFGDLEAHFQEMRARVAYFWQDLHALQQKGLTQSAAQELITAGPLQAGDAMGRLLGQLNAMGDDAARSAMERLNGHANAIMEMNRQATRAIAEQILLSQDQSRALTDAEATELAKEALDIKTKINQNVDQIKGGATAVAETMRLAGRDVGPDSLSAQFARQIDSLIATLTSGRGTAQQAGIELARAMSLGTQLSAQGGEDVNKVVGYIQTIAQAAIGFRSELNTATHTLGVDMGDGLTFGFGDSVFAGVTAVLDEAGKMVLEGAKAITAMWGTAMVTAREAFAAEMGSMWTPSMEISMAKIPEDKLLLPPEVATALEKRLQYNRDLKASWDEYTAGLQRPAPGPMGGTGLEELEDIAKAAEPIEDVAQGVRDAIDPIQLFGEALEKSAGAAREFFTAVDDFSASTTDLAETMIDLTTSTEHWTKRNRDLNSAVTSVLESIRKEAEAAARAGAIHNDVASITGYMQRRLLEVRNTLPQVTRELLNGAKGAEKLVEQIDKVRDALSKGLDIEIGVDKAISNARQSYYALKEAIEDNRALLTGAYLSDKDRADIHGQMLDPLHDYIEAIKEEALAMARAGRIGSDHASIQRQIRQRLLEAQGLYPELSEEIGRYITTLDKVPEEAKPTEMQVLMDEALRQLDTYNAQLADVPSTAETIIQMRIDEAMAQAAKDALDDIAKPRISTIQPNLVSGPTPSFVPPPPPSDDQALIDAIRAAPPTGGEVIGGGGGGGGPVVDATLRFDKSGLAPLPDAVARATKAIKREWEFNASNWLNSPDHVKAQAAAESTNKEFSALTRAVNEEAAALVRSGELSGDWNSVQGYVIRRMREISREHMPELSLSIDNYAREVESVPGLKSTEMQAISDPAKQAVGIYHGVISQVPGVKPTKFVADTADAKREVDNYFANDLMGKVGKDIFTRMKAVTDHEALGQVQVDRGNIGMDILPTMKPHTEPRSFGEAMRDRYRIGEDVPMGMVPYTNGWGWGNVWRNKGEIGQQVNTPMVTYTDPTGWTNVWRNRGELSQPVYVPMVPYSPGGWLSPADQKYYLPQGNPMTPWQHDSGGWLMPGVSLMENRTGRPEAVLNPGQWDGLIGALNALAAGGTGVRVGQMIVQTDNARGFMEEGAYAAVYGTP